MQGDRLRLEKVSYMKDSESVSVTGSRSRGALSPSHDSQFITARTDRLG